ncbi:TOMM precursor leader peptide-binding protein [Thermospira aquatica]|uniref:TOMM leader peptide-binding protein n=1 Tax=Thermospira aquatica TaxID=2828656 RepID=A0AAX3BF65_9SPIR|nr:TOMM precursor leader peptide-binding protein [Thermospira aquatica]URA11007.1 TOMM precursor leader peptide-binding protein [Thermospira aquatica]
MRYKKRRYVFLLEENPQSLFVDHLGNWFLLRGQVIEVLVRDLLSYLDEPHTLEEIVAEFENRARAEDIQDALNQLVRLGVLEECDDVSGDEGVVGFLGLFTPYLEEKKTTYLQRLERASVLVLGEGRVAQGIEEGLRESRVQVKRSPWLNEEDSSLSGRVQSLLRGFSLVIVTGSGRSLGFLEAVNEAAMLENVRVLYVEEDWTGGVVGPLVIPGETPCYRCYLERKQTNKEYDIGFELMRKVEGDVNTQTGFSPFVMWLVSIAVTESVKFLSWYLPCEMVKGVFLVDAVNYRVQFHPVLKSPYCSVCGYVDRIPPQMVWTEDNHGV